MIEFKYRSPEWMSGGMPPVSLQMQTEAESLENVLIAFRDFLRGVGYQIDGTLEVIGEDEWIESSQSEGKCACQTQGENEDAVRHEPEECYPDEFLVADPPHLSTSEDELSRDCQAAPNSDCKPDEVLKAFWAAKTVLLLEEDEQDVLVAAVRELAWAVWNSGNADCDWRRWDRAVDLARRIMEEG
jgi:hypothetical protein